MSGRFSCACTRRSGFTLVELMVVLAIIVILVAMLMPFMDGIRERGYVTLCQNNLQKIGQAMAISGSRAGGRKPTDATWLLASTSYGSQDILICPKGSYRGGGTGVTVSGAIEVVPAPKSAALGDYESSTTVRMWQEREAYFLPVSVNVNCINPGVYDTNFSTVAGAIPAGTMVDCYFLHFDPAGSQASYIRDQKITFSEDILGILWNVSTLDPTDTVLGSPSTAGYETGVGARGFENGQEHVTFDTDKRTFIIREWYSTSPGEEVRILTTPGGRASYGVNAKVDNVTSGPEQIYIVEYQRNMVEIDYPGWQAYSAPRHFGKSNALFWDGSVKLLTPEEYNPKTGPWRPKR